MFLFGTLLSATAQVPSYVPSNGLVGWWPFSGNANDQSGNGNNGTVSGATLTTDRFGNSNSAYSFDGVNDFIDYPSGANSSLNVIGDFSVCFWMKTNQGVSNRTIISFGEQLKNNSGGYTIGINDGITQSPFGRLGYATQGQWNNSTIIMSDDIWHFVVITLQGSTLKLFIDNNLNSSNSNQLSVLSWNGNRRIGAGNYAQIGFYEDLLDDIGIWNRALTQQEITNLYNGNICYKSITVTDTLVINVNRTSYNPLAYANTIKVYPNPTNDKITIDNGDLSKMTGYSIKIYNSIGQQLFQSNINQQQFSIDISQWGGNGLYFMELKDNNGNIVEVKKIVLQ
jgi:hypothetical protein